MQSPLDTLPCHRRSAFFLSKLKNIIFFLQVRIHVHYPHLRYHLSIPCFYASHVLFEICENLQHFPQRNAFQRFVFKVSGGDLVQISITKGDPHTWDVLNDPSTKFAPAGLQVRSRCKSFLANVRPNGQTFAKFDSNLSNVSNLLNTMAIVWPTFFSK